LLPIKNELCLFQEQTVRGLEPEVQRLMSRHASEIADIEGERDRRLAALVNFNEKVELRSNL
jgi:hypothetical protein